MKWNIYSLLYKNLLLKTILSNHFEFDPLKKLKRNMRFVIIQLFPFHMRITHFVVGNNEKVHKLVVPSYLPSSRTEERSNKRETANSDKRFPSVVIIVEKREW